MQKTLTEYKLLLSLTLALGLFATGSVAHAMTPLPPKVGTTTPRAIIKDARGQIINERADEHRDIADLKKTFRAGATSSATSTRKEMREDLREDIKDRREQASTTIQNIKEERNKRVKENMGLVRNRLVAAADRLDATVARIESRMKKLSDAGANVSKEQALVTDAKSLIAQARAGIASSTPLADGVTTAPKPKEQFEKVKKQYNGIQELLKKAQKDLVDAVVLLAKEPRTGKTTASSTAPTN